MVVFSGGGTGGHLYPALAIADALRVLRPDVRIVFVGAERGLEASVLPQRGEEHLLLPVAGFDRRRPLRNGSALLGLARGLARVGCLFRDIRPEVVVVTGGYAGAAAGIGAGLLGVPLLLQEQNSVPGAVTRLLARFAERIHVAFPEAIDRLPVGAARCRVSGNPVRGLSTLTKSEARRSFGIPDDGRLVLVTGGSQGSLAINRVVTSFIEGVCDGDLVRTPGMHLLWATGRRHFDDVEAALRATGMPTWVHAVSYLEDVPGALVAADLAVSRAGAMTTAEFVNQGLPAILVPLPTAAANHQMHNARALEAAGSARVVCENELTPGLLAEQLSMLLTSPELLAEMRSRALERARPNATSEIALDIATWLGPARRSA